jgi:phosphatidylglycerol lysyltransferase
MRRADDSPPGVVEASIAEAALKLRDAGAAKLSLGLAPLFRLDPHGPFEERLLQLAGRAVGSRYDVQSLAFFKGKFDPVWIPRYGATRHRRDIGGYALALLRVHVRPTSPRSGSTSGVTQ